MSRDDPKVVAIADVRRAKLAAAKAKMAQKRKAERPINWNRVPRFLLILAALLLAGWLVQHGGALLQQLIRR